jgi:hypothetical protein
VLFSSHQIVDESLGTAVPHEHFPIRLRCFGHGVRVLHERRGLHTEFRHLQRLELRHVTQVRGRDQRHRPHVVVHKLVTQHRLGRRLALGVQRVARLRGLVHSHVLHGLIERLSSRRRDCGEQLHRELVQELLDAPQHVELPNLLCPHGCPLPRGVNQVGRLSLHVTLAFAARGEDSRHLGAGVVRVDVPLYQGERRTRKSSYTISAHMPCTHGARVVSS